MLKPCHFLIVSVQFYVEPGNDFNVLFVQGFLALSKSFLNCRLTSTRLLIKWFLIKRTLYAYHRGIAQFEDSTLQIQVNYLISKHYEIIFDLNYT